MNKFDLIILCGGLGKRIKSESKNFPKSLIEINKKPFLIYLLKTLNHNSYRKIYLSVGYRRSKLIRFTREYKKTKLNYSIEKKLLGTGGAIKNTLKNHSISDPFFVINGDTYIKVDHFKLLEKYRQKNKKKSIIVLRKSENKKRFDQFKIVKNKIKMVGKNSQGNYVMNCGLYLFHKRDFKMKKKIFSIENDVINNLISKNKLDYYINKSNFFFDIGVPKDLNRFKKYIKN